MAFVGLTADSVTDFDSSDSEVVCLGEDNARNERSSGTFITPNKDSSSDEECLTTVTGNFPDEQLPGTRYVHTAAATVVHARSLCPRGACSSLCSNAAV